MRERDAVMIIDDNIWQVGEIDGERSISVSSGIDLLRALALAAGLSGDGKVVLDFTGDQVTVAGVLDGFTVDDYFYEYLHDEQQEAVQSWPALYRIVEPT